MRRIRRTGLAAGLTAGLTMAALLAGSGAPPGAPAAATGDLRVVNAARVRTVGAPGSSMGNLGDRGRVRSGLSTGRVRSGLSTGHKGSPGSRRQGNISGVIDGDMFGGNMSFAAESSHLGRRLAIVRVFYSFGQKFPMRADARLMAAGSTLLVSLDTQTRSPSYASIAAGHYDAYLRAFLEGMNRSAIQYHLGAIYFDFEHEPNVIPHHALGSPAEFARAWDHIHRLAASAHVNWNDGGRLHWVYILTHEAYVPMSTRPHWAIRMGSAVAYWPGNGDVDVVAADGYRSWGCKTGEQADDNPRNPASPESLFGPAVGFARSHGGLPVFIAEWGATYFPTTVGQVRFIYQMRSFLSANHQVRGIMYWDTRGIGPHCNYSIDGQPPSVAAMRAVGHSAVLQGHTV